MVEPRIRPSVLRRPSSGRRSVLLALLSASIACGGGAKGCSRGLPSDAEVARRFSEHEAQFEELARMSDEDAHVWRIAPTFTWSNDGGPSPSGTAPSGLSPERWGRYKELFRACGLDDGLVRERGAHGEGVFFPVAIVPLGAVDSEEKGIVFLPAPPPAVVPSLDREPLAAHKATASFAALKGRWYVYARSNE